jgi:hypothetical protein
VDFNIEIHNEVTVNPGLPSERRIGITVACNNYIGLEFLADGMVGKTLNALYCSLDKNMSFFSFLFLRLWYCSCRVYFIK